MEREVPIGSLVGHLQAAPVVQQNAVALINALLSRADPTKRKTLAATLTSKQVRTVIQNNILQTGAASGAEMAHQLYVLQTLMLGLLEQRMMTKMDPQVRFSLFFQYLSICLMFLLKMSIWLTDFFTCKEFTFDAHFIILIDTLNWNKYFVK